MEGRLLCVGENGLRVRARPFCRDACGRRGRVFVREMNFATFLLCSKVQNNGGGGREWIEINFGGGAAGMRHPAMSYEWH